MVEALLHIGLLIAVFVGFNIGGATTGPSFGPAIGADVVSKTVAGGLMSVFFFLGAWTIGRCVVDTLGKGLLYGLAFSLGFVYLLFVGMDPRVATFQGGLVFGYFLRVWEKMTVYERILQEEIAEEAEEIVPEEVMTEVEEQVQEEVSAEVEEQVTAEIDQQLADQIPVETTEQLTSDIEELLERQLGSDVDEDVPGDVVNAVCERIEKGSYDRQSQPEADGS